MIQASLPQAQILYRDNELLAVNKPAGVPVHDSRILADQPVTLLRIARELGGGPVHPVHRLDRPVSGVCLFTRDRGVLARISRRFEEREVRKCYLAVTRGWTDEAGEIDHPLLPPKDRRKPGATARDAVTRFERIGRIETPFPVRPYATSRYSLLALYPVTGRRHQLRMHMKHISHHLVGDTTYGRGEHNRLFREQFGCQRLLLHAWTLEFDHPVTERRVLIQAPLDASFASVLERFDWLEAIERRL